MRQPAGNLALEVPQALDPPLLREIPQLRRRGDLRRDLVEGARDLGRRVAVDARPDGAQRAPRRRACGSRRGIFEEKRPDRGCRRPAPSRGSPPCPAGSRRSATATRRSGGCRTGSSGRKAGPSRSSGESGKAKAGCPPRSAARPRASNFASSSRREDSGGSLVPAPSPGRDASAPRREGPDPRRGRRGRKGRPGGFPGGTGRRRKAP